jgi:hypothetical protein
MFLRKSTYYELTFTKYERELKNNEQKQNRTYSIDFTWVSTSVRTEIKTNILYTQQKLEFILGYKHDVYLLLHNIIIFYWPLNKEDMVFMVCGSVHI